jgi:hypothetical protein
MSDLVCNPEWKEQDVAQSLKFDPFMTHLFRIRCPPQVRFTAIGQRTLKEDFHHDAKFLFHSSNQTLVQGLTSTLPTPGHDIPETTIIYVLR